jgi:hypothetical protein
MLTGPPERRGRGWVRSSESARRPRLRRCECASAQPNRLQSVVRQAQRQQAAAARHQRRARCCARAMRARWRALRGAAFVFRLRAPRWCCARAGGACRRAPPPPWTPRRAPRPPTAHRRTWRRAGGGASALGTRGATALLACTLTHSANPAPRQALRREVDRKEAALQVARLTLMEAERRMKQNGKAGLPPGACEFDSAYGWNRRLSGSYIGACRAAAEAPPAWR